MPARFDGRIALMEQLREEARAQAKKAIDTLNFVGLKTVKAIREGEISNWKDDTGNLRSSIGYLVLSNGKVVGRNFALVNNRGEEGLKRAKEFAQELAGQYPRGYVLIIVAGMDYASYVEDIDGKVVLAGSERFARDTLESILKDSGLVR